jgi:hypothetical protein
LDRSKHAAIYMSSFQPTMEKTEPKMANNPVEVEPARPCQKLDPTSQLNFGRVDTVEHNVKALPVGRITDGSMARFNAYVEHQVNR